MVIKNMEEAIQAVLGRSVKKGKIPCLTCGELTLSRGVFIPRDSKKFGGLKSKQRVVAYGACMKCIGEIEKNPELAEEAEEIILEDIKAHPEYLLQ